MGLLSRLRPKANTERTKSLSETTSKNTSNTNLEKTAAAKETDGTSTHSPVPETLDTQTEAVKPEDAQHGPTALEAMEEREKETEHRDGDDELVYPSGLKLAVITLALCLSVFLVALDNTIIATAIPRITDHFHSLGDVGWYGSAYLLTTCALQLFFGK